MHNPVPEARPTVFRSISLRPVAVVQALTASGEPAELTAIGRVTLESGRVLGAQAAESVPPGETLARGVLADDPHADAVIVGIVTRALVATVGEDADAAAARRAKLAGIVPIPAPQEDAATPQRAGQAPPPERTGSQRSAAIVP